jgi:hypothetical protein
MLAFRVKFDLSVSLPSATGHGGSGENDEGATAICNSSNLSRAWTDHKLLQELLSIVHFTSNH